ncbi:MAG: TetR/AcrR family transcriptional regulator [Alcanivoracaceae bacterium]|nr:TetR/AcrR family transcriptional regulator [Alcanivoracaceae bacterium]
MQENPNNNKLVWLKLGLNTIGKQGRNELKINLLCERLKVTKGSFYHWFSSKKDYERQLLQFWKQRFTQAFIEQAEKGKNNKEKLALLGRQCIEAAVNGNRLEFEINAWSFQDNDVKDFVYSVYKQRYEYLEKLLTGLYKSKNEVKKHALILYSLVVGVDFFYRKLSLQELELIFSDYLF